MRDVLKGIRRRHGTAPRKARAATTPIVKALVSTCGDGALIDIRDRAVVLLGFASALRRSELVALQVDDVEFGADGAQLRIRRSNMAVQCHAAMAGLDPAGFSAHSLRAGLATSAAAAGVPEADIQRQTRHKSVQVLRGYVRHGSVFRNNASGAVGL